MLKPKEIAEDFIDTGKSKTSLSIAKMLCLGIFAGMFIAFAGAGASAASCTVQDPSTSKLLYSMVFPAGLAMTVVAGSELFTGNSLIIISVLDKKVKVLAMLKNWLLVYIGNLIGSLLVAFAVVYSNMPMLFNGGVALSFATGAYMKVMMGFGEAFIKGILCNFLVCIAVWMAASAKDTQGKIAGLYFPILLFVVCGFEHSVANMFSIPAGILTSMKYDMAVEGLDWMGFLGNLVPVTLGNIAGGCLVGLGYWFAYVRVKKEKHAEVKTEDTAAVCEETSDNAETAEETETAEPELNGGTCRIVNGEMYCGGAAPEDIDDSEETTEPEEVCVENCDAEGEVHGDWICDENGCRRI